MLPILVQRYNKKSFNFLSSSKTRDKVKFYRLSDATFYDRINTMYKFIKPFLDKKCLFLRKMEQLIPCNSKTVVKMLPKMSIF